MVSGRALTLGVCGGGVRPSARRWSSLVWLRNNAGGSAASPRARIDRLRGRTFTRLSLSLSFFSPPTSNGLLRSADGVPGPPSCAGDCPSVPVAVTVAVAVAVVAVVVVVVVRSVSGAVTRALGPLSSESERCRGERSPYPRLRQGTADWHHQKRCGGAPAEAAVALLF